MSAYIVRVTLSAEIVGLYSAGTVCSLRELVDEVCDAGACEYATLPDGGIHFEDGAPKVPFADWCEDRGDPNPYHPLFIAAYTSESWTFEDDRRWRPLGRPS